MPLRTQAPQEDWDPELYRRFQSERLRPAMDLLARVAIDNPAEIADLGCGDGEVTLALAKRWPGASIVGVDNSPRMLNCARLRTSTVTWLLQDIREWRPERSQNVIFCNASLHWMPDHESLMPSLADLLASPGTLAVQMPLSHKQKSHLLFAETLDELRITPDGATLDELFNQIRRPWMLDPSEYHALLFNHADRIELWCTEYFHTLSGENAIVDWVLGTALRPVVKHLSEQQLNRVLAQYASALAEEYPRSSDGTVLFPYRRMFMIVSKT